MSIALETLERATALRMLCRSPRNIPNLKPSANKVWTPQSLASAFGLSAPALVTLLRRTRFTVDVRSTNAATAGTKRGVHPGRIWIRGRADILAPRGGPVEVMVYSEQAGFVDLRYSGSTSMTARVKHACKRRAEMLFEVCAHGSLEEIVAALNQRV